MNEDEKILEISVKSFEEFKKDSLEKMEKFEQGESVTHSISFENQSKIDKLEVRRQLKAKIKSLKKILNVQEKD